MGDTRHHLTPAFTTIFLCRLFILQRHCCGGGRDRVATALHICRLIHLAGIGSPQGTEAPSRSCLFTRDVKDYESEAFRPAGRAAGDHYYGHPEPLHCLSITVHSPGRGHGAAVQCPLGASGDGVYTAKPGSWPSQAKSMSVAWSDWSPGPWR